MSNATAKIQTLVNKYHNHLNAFGAIIFEWVNVLPYNLILTFISKDSITLAAFRFRCVLKASIQEKLCVGRKHLLLFLQRVKCLEKNVCGLYSVQTCHLCLKRLCGEVNIFLRGKDWSEEEQGKNKGKGEKTQLGEFSPRITFLRTSFLKIQCGSFTPMGS